MLSGGHFDDAIALRCMLLRTQIANVAIALLPVCSWGHKLLTLLLLFYLYALGGLGAWGVVDPFQS